MRTLLTTCTAAAAAAALALPAAAAADSVVFLDGGNVHSAEADGSKRVQLTTEGDWHSVAQADDGTIAAARGLGSITVLARDGRPLRTIATVPARTGNGGAHRGTPINLAFSPDGSKIAYEYFDVTCPPASSCPSEQHSVLYTDANPGGSATPHGTYGQQVGRRDPSFVTNGRALLFGGSGAQVNLDDLGGGDGSDALWFNGNADFSDGELSRDGSRLALNVGHGAETRIGFFRVSGDPRTSTPAGPTPDDIVCSSSPDAKNGGATWSPDGNALAYESSKGIEVVRFSSFAPGQCGVAGESVLAPAGSEPDWGPADPPAARWTPPAQGGGPAPGGTPRPGGAAGGGGPTVAPGAARLTVRAPRLAVALRRGLTVRLAGARAGTHTLTARSGRSVVARGTVRVSARGTGRATVRFTRDGQRRLRGGRRVVLRVTGAGTAATVTLRR